jgi:hypothetical protein
MTADEAAKKWALSKGWVTESATDVKIDAGADDTGWSEYTPEYTLRFELWWKDDGQFKTMTIPLDFKTILAEVLEAGAQ